MQRQNGLGAVGELDGVPGADGNAARGRERGTETRPVGLHDDHRLPLVEGLDLQRRPGAADARGAAADGLVGVNVRDYGVGLPKHDSDKIFSHFFSTKPNGMGMGLTIVRSIIEAHDGKLGAEDLGDGARFFFALPSREAVP